MVEAGLVAALAYRRVHGVDRIEADQGGEHPGALIRFVYAAMVRAR